MKTPTNTILEKIDKIFKDNSHTCPYESGYGHGNMKIDLLILYTQELSTLFTQIERDVIGQCMSCKNEDNPNNWCDVHLKMIEQRQSLEKIRKEVLG